MVSTRSLGREDNRLGSLPLFLSLFLLLLAFFIFLNSISSFEAGKSDRVLQSIRASFPGIDDTGEGSGILDGDEGGAIERSVAERLEEAFVFAFPRLRPRIITETERLHVDIPLDRLFAPGTATPKAAVQVLTKRLSRVLASPSPRRRLETQILFGYAGAAGQLAKDRLTLTRASLMIERMLNAGSPPRLTSIGFEPGHVGDLRFRIRAVRDTASPASQGAVQ